MCVVDIMQPTKSTRDREAIHRQQLRGDKILPTNGWRRDAVLPSTGGNSRREGPNEHRPLADVAGASEAHQYTGKGPCISSLIMPQQEERTTNTSLVSDSDVEDLIRVRTVSFEGARRCLASEGGIPRAEPPEFASLIRISRAR